MFPYITRIFWGFAQPLSVVALLLLLAFATSFLRRRWPSRTALGLGLSILFVLCFTTFGYLVVAPLEARFLRPPEPARIDGIVVLGGGMDTGVNTVRHGWELSRSGDRFVETLRLALHHPEARIVIAAGQPALTGDEEPEALAAQRFFAAFDIAPGRITIDDKSRNTEENAQFAHGLTGDTSGQTWLLVTSAFHMPRSVGLFRKAGFDVTPWPADYLGTGEEGFQLKLDQAPENLAVATIALREWAGLLGYYLTGRISEVFPGP